MLPKSFFLATVLSLSLQTVALGGERSVFAASESLDDNVMTTRQRHFDKHLPAGNYSGITHIGYERYAVVSDKSPEDGFFVFKIRVDSLTGEIVSAENEGFFGDSLTCRDAEGIAFLPRTNTLLVVGEADSSILEYDLSGRLTGRFIQLEAAHDNRGYESLTYNDSTATLWTCTEYALDRDRQPTDGDENILLRLQSFDLNFAPLAQYLYRMDAPQSRKRHRYYAHGVSEMVALDDGTLLILEREVHVPRRYLGATVECKLYRVKPTAASMIAADADIDGSVQPLEKTLACRWQSRLNLFSHSLANYEGACIAPPLADGATVVLLIADSQNRAGGVLHDYMRTVVLGK